MGKAARGSNYLRWSPDVESKQDREDDDLRAVRESFAKIRDFAFEKHRHGLRDAHAKSHGILRGTLEVHDALAPELAQGLFARPASHDVIVRFSTSPGALLPDGVAALRGMALKVLEVEGPQLLDDHADAATQDLLLCNSPTFAVKDLHGYRLQAPVIDKLTRQPEELQVAGTTVLRAGAAVLRRAGLDVVGGAGGQAVPQTHLLGETYFTQAALRYGQHVAKLRAAPSSPELRALTGQGIKTTNQAVLRDLVVEFFARSGAEYEVQVQLATDLDTTPVEDASKQWPEDQTPYRAVARLELPAQDPFSPARRVFADDVLSFNPWHGLVEHQPLGSLQRARRPVYDDSQRDRHARNAVALHEPRSIEELPD